MHMCKIRINMQIFPHTHTCVSFTYHTIAHMGQYMVYSRSPLLWITCWWWL